MVEEIAAVIDCAAGSYADEDMGLGVVWNGSCTFNVFNLFTGENCDVFMVTNTPANPSVAFEIARDWVESLAYSD